TGPLQGSLSIGDNTAAGPHSISLSGTGTTAATPCASLQLPGQPGFACGAFALPLTFGTVAVGTTGRTQTANLSTTFAPLTISSITTTGDFHQTNTCPVTPQTLAAG